MSLYDDVDSIKARTTEKVAGWSSGIKLLQSQLQLKKAAVTQPRRDAQRRTQVLPPVIDLKSKSRDEDDLIGTNPAPLFAKTVSSVRDFDWNLVNEYDPMWPNDYEKVAREMKAKRERGDDERDRERTEKKRKSRFGDNDDDVGEKKMMTMKPLEEEISSEVVRRGAGAAIAPPPSLQEAPPEPLAPAPASGPAPAPPAAGYGTSSIAAKIMAKYGFKEGQGLGKKEQGMAVALQVEKTSKRGGRIIHEKDAPMPPPPPPLPGQPGQFAQPGSPPEAKPEPSITEMMKNPSKVVLLRNMVGPGDVDEDLEPEVKDECNGKYGEVSRVLIYEVPGTPPEEAVRIFVEFRRIESAIKAVVDLNGRFFGGRQVRAGFYGVERFAALQLLD